ncbi:D-glycero-beta-D-manno-heptose 1,7-bisphosphate 7-phosphatase [bacterium]|jgi:D-glycero-D-manno-heptose 1,7-bisphosphate phosphatase|nr:D-glycero-beta-D-manno-heptose 1,7-bisphosphate 7-phosphatase [bacterium]
MTIKTIFLDRDGVINKDINYLHKIKDFQFIDGTFEACKYLCNLDYKIIIITNQSGIGRGFYTESDFKILTNWMVSQFMENNIEILDVFHCPHSPNSNCNCRKPKPGLIFKAKEMYKINLEKSWMIGDSERDILAANSAGIFNTALVRTGHPFDELTTAAKYVINSIHQSQDIILD